MAMNSKGLAKLLEELGELTQITAKKLAYLDTDDHPDGAGSMITRMEEEMGDVLAACEFVQQKLDLNIYSIRDRSRRKLALYQKWDENHDL